MEGREKRMGEERCEKMAQRRVEAAEERERDRWDKWKKEYGGKVQ